MQSPDQIAADLLAEDVLQPVPGDRLVVGDGSEHRDIIFVQVQKLFAHIRSGPDRCGVGGPRPQHPTAGDLCHFE
jgi:hypothetical protein